MSNVYSVLSVINLVLGITVIIGGMFAFRYGFTRTAHEVQERVIIALQSEINALKDRIDGLEKDNTRLTQTISLIRAVLKQRGLSITIDGDVVSISDAHGHSTQASRIQTIINTNP